MPDKNDHQDGLDDVAYQIRRVARCLEIRDRAALELAINAIPLPNYYVVKQAIEFCYSGLSEAEKDARILAMMKAWRWREGSIEIDGSAIQVYLVDSLQMTYLRFMRSVGKFPSTDTDCYETSF
jgi:hypothetical protein